MKAKISQIAYPIYRIAERRTKRTSIPYAAFSLPQAHLKVTRPYYSSVLDRYPLSHPPVPYHITSHPIFTYSFFSSFSTNQLRKCDTVGWDHVSVSGILTLSICCRSCLSSIIITEFMPRSESAAQGSTSSIEASCRILMTQSQILISR